jgi:Ca2+/Na+ antiporter
LPSTFQRLHLDLSGKRCPLGWAFFGAAFLLSWAAELAQKDLPQALAIALLALIAVLPEILFALRAQPGTSMGALLSSKVNNGRF